MDNENKSTYYLIFGAVALFIILIMLISCLSIEHYRRKVKRLKLELYRETQAKENQLNNSFTTTNYNFSSFMTNDNGMTTQTSIKKSFLDNFNMDEEEDYMTSYSNFVTYDNKSNVRKDKMSLVSEGISDAHDKSRDRDKYQSLYSLNTTTNQSVHSLKPSYSCYSVNPQEQYQQQQQHNATQNPQYDNGNGSLPQTVPRAHEKLNIKTTNLKLGTTLQPIYKTSPVTENLQSSNSIPKHRILRLSSNNSFIPNQNNNIDSNPEEAPFFTTKLLSTTVMTSPITTSPQESTNNEHYNYYDQSDDKPTQEKYKDISGGNLEKDHNSNILNKEKAKNQNRKSYTEQLKPILTNISFEDLKDVTLIHSAKSDKIKKHLSYTEQLTPVLSKRVSMVSEQKVSPFDKKKYRISTQSIHSVHSVQSIHNVVDDELVSPRPISLISNQRLSYMTSEIEDQLNQMNSTPSTKTDENGDLPHDQEEEQIILVEDDNKEKGQEERNRKELNKEKGLTLTSTQKLVEANEKISSDPQNSALARVALLIDHLENTNSLSSNNSPVTTPVIHNYNNNINDNTMSSKNDTHRGFSNDSLSDSGDTKHETKNKNSKANNNSKSNNSNNNNSKNGSNNKNSINFNLEDNMLIKESSKMNGERSSRYYSKQRLSIISNYSEISDHNSNTLGGGILKLFKKPSISTVSSSSTSNRSHSPNSYTNRGLSNSTSPLLKNPNTYIRSPLDTEMPSASSIKLNNKRVVDEDEEMKMKDKNNISYINTSLLVEEGEGKDVILNEENESIKNALSVSSSSLSRSIYMDIKKDSSTIPSINDSEQDMDNFNSKKNSLTGLFNYFEMKPAKSKKRKALSLINNTNAHNKDFMKFDELSESELNLLQKNYGLYDSDSTMTDKMSHESKKHSFNSNFSNFNYNDFNTTTTTTTTTSNKDRIQKEKEKIYNLFKDNNSSSINSNLSGPAVKSAVLSLYSNQSNWDGNSQYQNDNLNLKFINNSVTGSVNFNNESFDTNDDEDDIIPGGFGFGAGLGLGMNMNEGGEQRRFIDRRSLYSMNQPVKPPKSQRRQYYSVLNNTNNHPTSPKDDDIHSNSSASLNFAEIQKYQNASMPMSLDKYKNYYYQNSFVSSSKNNGMNHEEEEGVKDSQDINTSFSSKSHSLVARSTSERSSHSTTSYHSLNLHSHRKKVLNNPVNATSINTITTSNINNSNNNTTNTTGPNSNSNKNNSFGNASIIININDIDHEKNEKNENINSNINTNANTSINKNNNNNNSNTNNNNHSNINPNITINTNTNSLNTKGFISPILSSPTTKSNATFDLESNKNKKSTPELLSGASMKSSTSVLSYSSSNYSLDAKENNNDTEKLPQRIKDSIPKRSQYPTPKEHKKSLSTHRKRKHSGSAHQPLSNTNGNASASNSTSTNNTNTYYKNKEKGVTINDPAVDTSFSLTLYNSSQNKPSDYSNNKNQTYSMASSQTFTEAPETSSVYPLLKNNTKNDNTQNNHKNFDSHSVNIDVNPISLDLNINKDVKVIQDYSPESLDSSKTLNNSQFIRNDNYSKENSPLKLTSSYTNINSKSNSNINSNMNTIEEEKKETKEVNPSLKSPYYRNKYTNTSSEPTVPLLNDIISDTILQMQSKKLQPIPGRVHILLDPSSSSSSPNTSPINSPKSSLKFIDTNDMDYSQRETESIHTMSTLCFVDNTSERKNNNSNNIRIGSDRNVIITEDDISTIPFRKEKEKLGRDEGIESDNEGDHYYNGKSHSKNNNENEDDPIINVDVESSQPMPSFIYNDGLEIDNDGDNVSDNDSGIEGDNEAINIQPHNSSHHSQSYSQSHVSIHSRGHSQSHSQSQSHVSIHSHGHSQSHSQSQSHVSVHSHGHSQSHSQTQAQTQSQPQNQIQLQYLPPTPLPSPSPFPSPTPSQIKIEIQSGSPLQSHQEMFSFSQESDSNMSIDSASGSLPRMKKRYDIHHSNISPLLKSHSLKKKYLKSGVGSPKFAKDNIHLTPMVPRKGSPHSISHSPNMIKCYSPLSRIEEDGNMEQNFKVTTPSFQHITLEGNESVNDFSVVTDTSRTSDSTTVTEYKTNIPNATDQSASNIYNKSSISTSSDDDFDDEEIISVDINLISQDDASTYNSPFLFPVVTPPNYEQLLKDQSYKI